MLKRNCKIGNHSVFRAVEAVGENAIIEACSFVNNDIPDNIVAFSVPADPVYTRTSYTSRA